MHEVTEPIFFIGVPRSGTTLLFEAFAMHKQLGWPSNYSRIFPRIPQFGLLLHFLNNRFINLMGQKQQYNQVSIFNKFLPKPAEAYPFWDHYTEIDFSKQFLINATASKRCISRVQTAVDAILHWQGKWRFSAKLTGPSRIHFLKSIFPKAKFIHVIRDGRAVVNSMLNSGTWTSSNFLEKPWWKGGLTDSDLYLWDISNKNPAVLAAIQWKKIIEIAQKESIKCCDENYIEIKYEDIIEKPYDSLSQLYTWSNLPESDRCHHYIKNLNTLHNMNDKFRKDMTENEIRLISEIMQPLLGNLGYG